MNKNNLNEEKGKKKLIVNQIKLKNYKEKNSNSSSFSSSFSNSSYSNISLQKPFLKWVGGKTQIINQILDKFPKEMNNYHEIFLGGGSVLLALLTLQRENKIKIKNKIYAYDINDTLINVYKNVQKNKEKLYSYIKYYVNEYDSLEGNVINRKPKTLEEAKTSKESYYYWLRNQFNEFRDKSSIQCSALFMFINKTCFRGVYREGPNGFNVPYGHYKNTPQIVSMDDLNNISDLIKNVEFIKSDFSESMKNINSGDFVYYDPPYAPENSKSFVSYVSDGFKLELHEKLFNFIKQLDKNKRIKFVMSNANVDLVKQSFKDYKFDEIIARRAINSKNPSSTAKELIIYN